MPLNTSALSDISVVSVHDEEEPIHFSIPSIVPSRYEIPGINADKKIFEDARFTFPDQKPFQYAIRRTLNHHPYVLIRIVEPKTFIYGTEQMKLDEYNQKLSPDVQRVPVPVRQELIANEVERQCGFMGIKAIRGDVTLQILEEVERTNIDFLRKTVQEVNRVYKRFPGQVTPQSRRRATRLYKMGLLNPLPEWAEINPEALSGQALDMMNCVNCSKLIKKSIIKCDCGAIYNWKAAVEFGMVKPSEVPPSKRVEAGLEEGPMPKQKKEQAKELPRTTDNTAPPPGPDPVNAFEDEEEEEPV